MRKKTRVKVKIRTLLTFVITIVLFGYVSFSVIYYGISKNKFEQEEIALKEKLENLKEQEIDLNSEISKLKDDDYLARYAREEYSYSKKGEYIIKLEENEEAKEVEIVEKSKITIYYFIPIILIIGVSIFIIFKKKKIKLSKWQFFIIKKWLDF